jgi:hypothetical protein
VDLPVFTTPFVPVPIAELPLPAGKYLISGTVDVNNLFPNADDAATCELNAGADFDRASPTLDAPSASSGIQFRRGEDVDASRPPIRRTGGRRDALRTPFRHGARTVEVPEDDRDPGREPVERAPHAAALKGSRLNSSCA